MEIERNVGSQLRVWSCNLTMPASALISLIPPGHEDFSEDTYRTLMAVDSAVMVIDSAKGIEPQPKNFSKFVKCGDPDLYIYQ